MTMWYDSKISGFNIKNIYKTVKTAGRRKKSFLETAVFFRPLLVRAALQPDTAKNNYEKKFVIRLAAKERKRSKIT